VKVHKWSEVQARHLTPAEIAESRRWAKQEAERLRQEADGPQKGPRSRVETRSTQAPGRPSRKR
jgi:hypothetical protein